MDNLKQNTFLFNTDLINSDGQVCYDDAVSALTSQGKFHISLGLDIIGRVLDLLGNPQKILKIIHVAGTNGKGSTCAMLSSVLTEAGYKTGFYSSPHLVEYTERIKIDDNEISKEDFAKLVFKVIETAEKSDIHVTEFEILTAAAFLYFKEKEVEFVLLETGLGGRLDATNIVEKPILTILTSIDIDHVDRLGNTIEKIAFEKAGIIKENVPVITLKNNNGLDVINQVAADKTSKVILADSSECSMESNTIITEFKKFNISLSGVYQLLNFSLVLEAVEFLNQTGIFISDQALRAGLSNTKWTARFQVMKDKNLILDGAHNESGAIALRQSLDKFFPYKKRIWIYSSLNTKNFESIVNILFMPDDTVICTEFTSPNAIKSSEIKEKITNIYPEIEIFQADNIIDAYNTSVSLATKEHVTIVSGSLYAIGDLLKFFNT
jgi:dihydrofolate synthase/folylpolyglutamate synthase